MLFICYPGCSTCKKAQAFLDEHKAEYTIRNIKTERPTALELADWQAKSRLPLKRFFNTSGLVYKNLGLKEKLGGMTNEEQLELLAQDGMLVKRPILVADDFVLVGFRLAEWQKALEL